MIDDLIAHVSAVAEDVYRELGPGHLEAPYQKAMEVGLRLRGVKFEAQRVVEICYADHYVGDCNVDLVVGGLVVVELKAAGQQVAAPDRQQIEKYLRLMGLKHGLLINFAKSGRAKRAKEPADKPEITVIELP